MGRDYKYRANQKRRKPQQPKVAWWKWGLIFSLIALFAYFLFFLSNSTPKNKTTQQTKTVPVIKKAQKPKPVVPKHQNKKPVEPRYDFYTILPETEIIVPDYEINTRRREEQLGKGKVSKYLIQAGSFREFSEADKLRAQLALMGIESRVEKATIGNVIWNRVKMGPYSQSSSVSIIKKRLRNNGIDVVVTEIKG